MAIDFLKFPSELRNRIYETLLLHEDPVTPWLHFNPSQQFTPGLFRASKTIHREGSSLFYAQNRFDFTMHGPEAVVGFLEQIGPENAGYIRNIRVSFPRFLSDAAGARVEEDDVSVLAKIQSNCSNLSTLTTSLQSTDYTHRFNVLNDMDHTHRLNVLNDVKIVDEVLKQVDVLFRAISSLQKIIVDLYDAGPSDHITMEMEGHGWIVSTTEPVKVVKVGDWSDSGSDGYGSWEEYPKDDDHDIDEYDIDNDSDFDRRAAD